MFKPPGIRIWLLIAATSDSISLSHIVKKPKMIRRPRKATDMSKERSFGKKMFEKKINTILRLKVEYTVWPTGFR